MSQNKCIVAMIAVYNNEKYVARAIESIVEQTYPNIQIGICNDASTDNSSRTITKLIENGVVTINDDEKVIIEGNIKNRKVSFISLKQNGRQGRARNFVIKHLWDSTDYFALCDSDDYQLPHKFELLAQKLGEFEQIGLCAGDYIIHNVDTRAETYESKPIYSKEHLMRECILHSNFMVRKEALAKVGLFFEDESPCEDYGLELRISDYFMCVQVPEPLTIVNIHNTNSSTVYGTEHHQAQFRKMISNYENWAKNQR